MSTVQSLLDDMQFRVDVTADLYHLINLAIRRIAARLYWHKSDIIRSELSLNVYAPVDYTANTIAFVNGIPDTITDSANGLVAAGFKAGMFIETDKAGNAGPFELATVVAGTLSLAAADNVTVAGAGSDVELTSLGDRVRLPGTFWGWCGDDKEDYPNIDGYTDVLLPLPNRRAALEAGTGSLPRWFKIKGNMLYLYPATGSDITIKGDCFVKPTAVTALTDTLPFYELFDEAIEEVLAMLYEKGLSSQGENQALLDKMLLESVDLVVPLYGCKAPTGHQGGVDWASLT